VSRGQSWFTLDPSGLKAPARRAFHAYARTLLQASRKQNGERERERALATVDGRGPVGQQAAQLVLRDLLRQGWQVRFRKGNLEIAQPDQHDLVAAEKERVRTQLKVERDEQLAQPAVRSFVRSMEVRRIHAGRAVSIFSLMRDGAELAAKLEDARRALSREARERALQATISPYLQFVTDDARCEWTGEKLLDVWRYFRHTWSSPYRSVPGRTMMLLIRDAAIQPHPVIGIAALSSAAVQISVRDKWIRWNSDDLLEKMIAEPTDDAAKWLQATIAGALDELYVDDLLEDKVITRAELRAPSERTIAALEAEAGKTRDAHRQFVGDGRDHRQPGETVPTRVWLSSARSPLFRSKRAELLATLLRAQHVLAARGSKKLTGAALGKLLATGEGRRAVRSIIKRARAERVGTAMADIAVCGAVAPYNALLGGKLVSMLLTSPEVTAAYRERYRTSCSVIASSMAGRPIVRPSELVLLCTTSLYGAGSSQYNRLQLPCELVGGRPGETVRYEELGHTAGYGTIHFGSSTIDAIERFLAQEAGGQRVNSIFGEGVSPRLRKVRDGLDALEFPSDQLLNHGSPRVVYGVALARNFREFLLGRAARPEYLLPTDEPAATTRAIARWWTSRWLSGRVERAEVLEDVRRHRIIHPVRHGARVILPREDCDQLTLLDD
jgi:hypothetical protein